MENISERNELLTEKAHHFLGSDQRVERFSNLAASPANWGGQNEEALTAESVAGFNAFCEIVSNMNDEREPALFLTKEGWLQVTVEREDGVSIALDFINASSVAIWISDSSEAAIPFEINRTSLALVLGDRKLCEFWP